MKCDCCRRKIPYHLAIYTVNGNCYCANCYRDIDKQPTTDIVNGPLHYTNGGIETIDYIKAKLTPEQYQGHLIANVLKYVSRHQHKNGVEDLKKARWYLDRLIGEMNGNM